MSIFSIQHPAGNRPPIPLTFPIRFHSSLAPPEREGQSYRLHYHNFDICAAPFAFHQFRSVPAFRTLPRKNRARESAAGFLPSRRFCWAQVQTGGAITAEPDACRPIIKIIESHKNRVTSDNLYSDYRKSG